MKFRSLLLQPWIQDVLFQNKFIDLTEIQEKSYKLVNQNNNVIISSQPGTGKTLCYALPIIDKINLENKNTQAIILVPTKELAIQLFNNFKIFSKANNALRVSLVDSTDKATSLSENKNLPQILVATVTRVKNLIKSGLDLSSLKTLVLDEADMLIDYGFIQDINYIFEKTNKYNVQKIIVSASIDQKTANVFQKNLINPKTVTITKTIYENKKVNNIIVHQKDNSNPQDTLFKLLGVIKPYFCIIFANNKHDVEIIYKKMLSQKFNVAILHKDLEYQQRKQIFNQLKNNKYTYLVATDLVSRGIDIDGVSDVISYDLPKESIWYLHRSGRTGRGKYFGNSYVIYQQKYNPQFESLKKKDIDWKYNLILNNSLIDKEISTTYKKKHAMLDLESKMQIRQIYNTSSKKVKPNYKKKIREQVYKIKQKSKRKYLDKKIKSQLNQRYKKGKKHENQ